MAENGGARDPVVEGVYVALFRVTSIAELSGDKKAVEWARSTLENPELLRSLGEGTRRSVQERRERSDEIRSPN
jgi:hypothetical protein